MSALLQFYPSDGATLIAVNSLLQVTIVIGVAMLLSQFVSRHHPAARHGIWFACLVCILVIPPASLLSGRLGMTFVTVPVPGTEVANRLQPDQSPAATSKELVSDKLTNSAESAEIGVSSAMASESQSHLLIRSTPERFNLLRVTVVFAGGLWGLGVMYYCIRLAHGYFVLRKVRYDVWPVDKETHADVFSRVRQSLGIHQLPSVMASASVSNPFVIGTLRPSVIIPEDLLEKHNSSQMVQVRRM